MFFEKGNSPCIPEIPKIKIRRRILDHHLPGIRRITLFYRRNICYRNFTTFYYIHFKRITTQTSRHAKLRQEINLFLQFSDSIRTTLIDNEKTQVVKVDLQRFLAWFIIIYFQHNLCLISTARKNFRLQISDKETILPEQNV